MPMPEGIGIVDLMLSFPIADPGKMYEFLRKAARDQGSKDSKFPVEYMFKGVPHDFGKGQDPLEATLAEMDKWGIERAMIGVGGETSLRALKEHPKRFIGCAQVDPNQGMDALRHMRRSYDELGIRAVTCFPAGLSPQVDINDKRFFPLYEKACELDEVCWNFPELTLVTYHGCEPWQDLAVKLMLKWPGLHYATSAFAPKHYPKAIIDYANTRGADKILYAGYFPMGLTLERIMTEMKSVPFRDPVWPKFLRENALRILKVAA